MYVPHFLYPLTMNIRLVPCLNVGNTTVLNIMVHVSFQIMVVSRHMPMSGIVGSYGSIIFSFFKELPYCSL